MDIKKILFRTNSIDVEKALPDAVIFCNKDGKIQWVNDRAAEFFETSKMHLLTSNVADFLENAQNLILYASNNETAVLVKFLTKELYYEMTAKEIEDGYVLDLRDAISKSVEIRQHVSALDEVSGDTKNNFMLKLSNDFKSPLQSIVGFSQAMADGLGGEMSEQQEKYIRIINKNSSELMYFINKMLELFMTESTIKNPEYKTFDLVNLTNSVVKFNEQLYKDKELRWNVVVEEGVKNTIVSDEELVKTVLQNILEVILKSVDMGDVILTLKIPEEEIVKSKSLFGENFVMLTISSSALLLSENDLEYMFDPYQIVDTTNKKNLLRAMTLACVKNIVQLLNGVVWVESKILKNTTFNVIIPQCQN